MGFAVLFHLINKEKKDRDMGMQNVISMLGNSSAQLVEIIESEAQCTLKTLRGDAYISDEILLGMKEELSILAVDVFMLQNHFTNAKFELNNDEKEAFSSHLAGNEVMIKTWDGKKNKLPIREFYENWLNGTYTEIK